MKNYSKFHHNPTVILYIVIHNRTILDKSTCISISWLFISRTQNSYVFRGGLHFSRIKTVCIQGIKSTAYPVINIQQDSLSVRDPVTPSSVQVDSSLINNSILSTRVFRMQNVCIMYVENPGKHDRHRSHSWAQRSIPVTHGGQHNTINIHMIQVIKTDRLFIISLWVINRARQGWKNNRGW